MRLQLERLRHAAVAGLVLPDALHPQRSLAAVRHLVVGERGHAFVVLKRPALEMVAVRVLEVGVGNLRRVIRLVGAPAPPWATNRRVFDEHAFGVVPVAARRPSRWRRDRADTFSPPARSAAAFSGATL